MFNIRKAGFLRIIFFVSAIILIYLSTSNPPPVYQIYRFISPMSPALTDWLVAIPIDVTAVTYGSLPFLAVNYLIIVLFGYVIAYPFFVRLGVFPVIQFIASFFVGYLCAIPLIRVLSIIIPYKYIYPLILIIILVYIYFQLSRHSNYPILRFFRFHSVSETKRNLYVLLFLISILFFSVLLLQIYQVDFKWFGHANINPFLDFWRIIGVEHFPIVTQHYEDLIFHYFLTISLSENLPSVMPWWLSLALLKVSVITLLYAFFRKLGAGFYSAIVFCIYIMIGTTSILPNKYYLLFEYANPLYFVAVSGRVIGIAFFIFMIVYGVYEAEKKRLSKSYFILAGAGLTAITIPNAFWVVIFYFLTVLFKYYYNNFYGIRNVHLKNIEYTSGKMSIYSSVLVSLLLYGLPFDAAWAHLLRFFLIILICILLSERLIPRLFIFFKRKSIWPEDFKITARLLVILILSVIAGVMFLGNVFVLNGLSKKVFQALGHIFGRIYFGVLFPPVSFGTFSFGDFRNLYAGSSYNWGIMPFAANYGGILLMILISDYLYTKNANTIGLKEYVLYEIFLTASGLLPILLWFTDFLGLIPVNTWNKTRFIELPVYYIIFYFLFSLGRFLRSKAKIIAIVILLIYSVVPFLATGRHKQIYANYLFLESMIKK
ncbi:MAG: hypothetical protein V2A64_05220 [Candidatus Omnitrophota bacterium]